MLKGGYNKGKELEEDYKKRCNECGILKDKNEFEINQIQAGNRLVRRGQCKSCRKWKKPINQKKKMQYMIEHPRPKIGGNFKCPICNKVKPVINNSSIALDHDHQTGKIRGYICLACNTGIGQLRDDIKVLERAINWIKNS